MFLNQMNKKIFLYSLMTLESLIIGCAIYLSQRPMSLDAQMLKSQICEKESETKKK
jgi:hypothetical protein